MGYSTGQARGYLQLLNSNGNDRWPSVPNSHSQVHVVFLFIAITRGSSYAAVK